jgi:hypothetical protein
MMPIRTWFGTPNDPDVDPFAMNYKDVTCTLTVSKLWTKLIRGCKS